MKFNGKCDGGLTRVDGKAYLVIYCMEGRVSQSCQADPPVGA